MEDIPTALSLLGLVWGGVRVEALAATQEKKDLNNPNQSYSCMFNSPLMIYPLTKIVTESIGNTQS